MVSLSLTFSASNIMHDWDDASCIRILRCLVPALIPGYSKILLNEVVVPDVGASVATTAVDHLMMAYLTVRERTENEFRELVAEAGLKVAKIWSAPGARGEGSLVECELAQD